MKIFLKECGICDEKTVHTTKRNFNETTHMTTVTVRCEICGDTLTRRIYES